MGKPYFLPMINCADYKDTKFFPLYRLVSWACKLVAEFRVAIRMVGLMPTMSLATLSAADVTLTWNDNSSDETGFRVERSTNGSSFSVLDTVAADVTTYSDETIQPSSTYWYRVNAYNEFGSSGYTNVVSHTTEPEVNSAPTISGLSNQSLDANSGGSNPVAFTIGDAETPAGQLLVSVTTSNGSLIPNQNVILSGVGSSRNVVVTPLTGLSGSSTITVYVTDGVNTVSDSFVVTVSPVANFALSDPTNGSTYHLGDSVGVDLSVLGGVTPVSVTYYLDGIPVQVVEQAPFNRSIELPVTGTLAFHVVARLSDGSELESQPVQIDVQDIVVPSSLTVSRFP